MCVWGGGTGYSMSSQQGKVGRGDWRLNIQSIRQGGGGDWILNIQSTKQRGGGVTGYSMSSQQGKGG